MARTARKMTTKQVAALNEPGRYSDGDGLYLQVDAGGRKRWIFMYSTSGKRREMGLGSARDVSLADARSSAQGARRLVREGRDPIEVRSIVPPEPQSAPTFGEFSDQLVSTIEHGFRNAKHRQQWRNTLATYAARIRDKRLDEIGTEDVLACLEPIWMEKNETASRVRGRIERVLDAAKAKGLRSGENPARWRGHLDHLLPKRQKLQRGHHPAMPYQDVPAFIALLRASKTVSALALEFTILTAARSGEVLGACWSEMHLESGVWAIPANRMKAGREHRVPLSRRALEILGLAYELRRGPFVFPGQRSDRPLSGMAMEMLLRRMKRDDVTVHGFRSSFRDWAGEATQYPREIAEAALAHVVGDQTERAYRRLDALERRRELMEAWGCYCYSGFTL